MHLTNIYVIQNTSNMIKECQWATGRKPRQRAVNAAHGKATLTVSLQAA